MSQSELFAVTRIGQSIVPPTPQELSRIRADDGIERASEHAKQVSQDWQTKAVGYVRLFALCEPAFLAEDVREMAERDGFDAPPDGRAWGAVMRQAAREGIVVSAGYAPANSSNGSPKVKWRSLVVAA